jgi:hypothetical protein
VAGVAPHYWEVIRYVSVSPIFTVPVSSPGVKRLFVNVIAFTIYQSHNTSQMILHQIIQGIYTAAVFNVNGGQAIARTAIMPTLC